MGVEVTQVLGQLQGPANSPWVHFVVALFWPMPLVGYDGWKGGALGSQKWNYKKNLRELKDFVP